MDHGDFQRQHALFVQASAVPPAQWRDFLVERCGDDLAMVDAVLDLLHRSTRGEESFFARVHAAAQDAALEPVEPLHPTQIGPYRVLGLLGEGGMGSVYLAERRDEVHRRAAIKVVKLGMDSRAILARFEVERRVLALMEHPCIATVFDANATAQGQPYFAMEYVQGSCITDYCDQQRLGLVDRIALFQKVCAGVAHAHSKGILHRDLKPANILVTMVDGVPTPKIIDFGLAKALDVNGDLVPGTSLTMQGTTMGTPAYMSPEQVVMDRIDARADVYSLGVMLHELLVGELPSPDCSSPEGRRLPRCRWSYEDDSASPSAHVAAMDGSRALRAEARRLSVREWQKQLSGDLDRIVRKAMQRDRTLRYATTQELSADLERHLCSEPILARPPGPFDRVRKFLRRRRVGVALASASSVAAICLVVAIHYGWEIQAKERLDHLDQLAAQAIEAESELYPAIPERVAAMRSWQDRFERLVGDLAMVTARRAELISMATREVAPPEDLLKRRSKREAEPHMNRRDKLDVECRREERDWQVKRYRFEDTADQGTYTTLTSLEQRLTDIAGPNGLIERVASRCRVAETVQRRTIDDHRQRWERAIAAIRASDDVSASKLYRNLELTPQIGLVPIGMNVRSKLWEFAYPASGATEDIPRPDPVTGELVVDGNTCIVLVLLPGGYLPVEDGAGVEHRHGVELVPFFVGKYEVTQGQWCRLRGRELPADADAAMPMAAVDWQDWHTLLGQHGFVMQSRLRWDYACRGGLTTPWWSGATRSTIDGQENLSAPKRVGSMSPNPFGLFDMCGNVWEWSLDAFGTSGSEAGPDGAGRRESPTPDIKVVCSYHAESVPELQGRCGECNTLPQKEQNDHLGIRVVREISGSHLARDPVRPR